MAKFGWILWGLLFSTVLFIALYFLIYIRVTGPDAPDILMLGNKDISGVGVFFSKIVNVILVSLIIGMLLGLVAGAGPKKEEVPIN